MFLKEAYTYEYMKRYVPIVIGVIALCAVLYVGNDSMKNDDSISEATTTEMKVTSFNGSVTKIFEGENVLNYGFDVAETATTTVEKEGALVKVADARIPVVAVYFSFEGGRGYSPADYISNIIVPNVKAVTTKENVTLGAHDWSVVESEWSVWHIAKSANGQWLIVTENKKTENEKAAPVIESIITK